MVAWMVQRRRGWSNSSGDGGGDGRTAARMVGRRGWWWGWWIGGGDGGGDGRSAAGMVAGWCGWWDSARAVETAVPLRRRPRRLNGHQSRTSGEIKVAGRRSGETKVARHAQQRNENTEHRCSFSDLNERNENSCARRRARKRARKRLSKKSTSTRNGGDGDGEQVEDAEQDRDEYIAARGLWAVGLVALRRQVLPAVRGARREAQSR